MPNKLAITVLLLGAGAAIPLYSLVNRPSSSVGFDGEHDPGIALVARAQRERRSDLSVETSGTVETVADADDRSLAQRFVLRLRSDVAVSVIHDLERAPAVPLRLGDRIRIRGRYHWDEDGGRIIGTHTDPETMHAGWILHRGTFYPPTATWIAPVPSLEAAPPVD